MPCVPASVKSPTFKSFKQVIAMGEIVGTVRGSLAGRAAPGEPEEKVDQLLFVADWRRCLHSWQCFFSTFCQFSKRLVTHLRRVSGRGHGGERGRKMTARPGVGRVSAPAVRGLRAGPGRPGGAMGIGHQGLSSLGGCSSSPRWRCVEM